MRRKKEQKLVTVKTNKEGLEENRGNGRCWSGQSVYRSLCTRKSVSLEENKNEKEIEAETSDREDK